jgi:hypothetical protein
MNIFKRLLFIPVFAGVALGLSVWILVIAPAIWVVTGKNFEGLLDAYMNFLCEDLPNWANK